MGEMWEHGLCQGSAPSLRRCSSAGFLPGGFTQNITQKAEQQCTPISPSAATTLLAQEVERPESLDLEAELSCEADGAARELGAVLPQQMRCCGREEAPSSGCMVLCRSPGCWGASLDSSMFSGAVVLAGGW